jgi:hypothetical protein
MLTVIRFIFIILGSGALGLISIIFLFNVILIGLGRLARNISIFLVILVGVNHNVCNEEIIAERGEE